ncbi:hypothetical protein ACS0TY_031134 [Phlomoides rotata]
MWASSIVLGNTTSPMEASPLEALVFDSSKCSKLSMEQKRELVYEMSMWPEGASEMLQAWNRQDILQILCAELGKDRKYTGLTKTKLIENLLQVVYEKKSQQPRTANASSIENGERSSKRQRKSDHPTNGAAAVSPHVDSVFSAGSTTVYCKNSACKAKMNQEDVFCKRCSCCICRQYDDNKDPSLWLICVSDPPFRGVSCGMSCHLECALRHKRSGVSQDNWELDGSFYCVSCGKVNDLLSCWRKQVLVGRDTRRVDILGYRLSLSQKILAGTKQYQNLYATIDEAVKMLEEDVGPLTGLPVKKARGIVNRLSSGPQIQKLCASALDSLDLMMLSNRLPGDMPSGCSKLVTLEDIRATSLMVIVNSNDSNMGESVGYSLWHRKADDADYPADPTHRLLKPNTKFMLSGLVPCTHYFLKAVSTTSFVELQFQTGASQDISSKMLQVETSGSPATICSSLSNPSSSPDAPLIDCNKEASTGEETSTDNGSNTHVTGLECVPYEAAAGLPITPCKFENVKDDNPRPKFSGKDSEEPQAGSSSKKKREEDKGFEYYVKVIRWLECDGHIETSFRQKFLTWYSLRAAPQEVRIVKVFIDTFVEDPESLADQLVHSFSDVISNKRCSRVPAGFCTKLWH